MTKFEALQFLTELMKEINSQDNRATATPYFFTLKDTDTESPVHRKNVFLTHKAALEHLEENSHHYQKSVFPYLDHAWRNPELLQLLEAVGVVVGEEYNRK